MLCLHYQAKIESGSLADNFHYNCGGGRVGGRPGEGGDQDLMRNETTDELDN